MTFDYATFLGVREVVLDVAHQRALTRLEAEDLTYDVCLELHELFCDDHLPEDANVFRSLVRALSFRKMGPSLHGQSLQ